MRPDCSVCGEWRRQIVGGMCRSHYRRFVKYGDPLAPRRRSGGRYGARWFEHHPERADDPAVFYVTVLTDGTHSGVKVGITAQSDLSRLRYPRRTGTTRFVRLTLREAFEVEQSFLRVFPRHPNARDLVPSSGGHTEVLDVCPATIFANLHSWNLDVELMA